MKKLLVLTIFAVTSCVSSGKYKDLEAQHSLTSNELAQAKQKASDQDAIIASLESKLGKTSSEKKGLETSVADMKKALDEMALRKKESDARIAEYASMTKKFSALIDSGKLAIKMQRGRMVVALSTDILFPSGSATLNAAGKSSLAEVAKVLASLKDKEFQIEGHTDDVPIKTAKYPSNWELASARAMTVFSTLVEEGMAEDRLSIASYGPTKPVGDNTTDVGKKSNRRIEIVVVPDLSSLPGTKELEKISGQ